MRISDVDKLAACLRCLNLLEIERTRDDATVKLGNPNVFGRYYKTGIATDAL